MAITPQEIAAALGVSPALLQTVLTTGHRQVQLDNLNGIIAHARTLDSQISATEQAQIDAVMQPIMAARSRRLNYIAALDAHWSEMRATPNGAVTVPTQQEVEAFLNEE